jgi:hypothetical protein
MVVVAKGDEAGAHQVPGATNAPFKSDLLIIVFRKYAFSKNAFPTCPQADFISDGIGPARIPQHETSSLAVRSQIRLSFASQMPAA